MADRAADEMVALIDRLAIIRCSGGSVTFARRFIVSP
jgi:hypothetical protein